jgi:hypothetical protein
MLTQIKQYWKKDKKVVVVFLILFNTFGVMLLNMKTVKAKINIENIHRLP